MGSGPEKDDPRGEEPSVFRTHLTKVQGPRTYGGFSSTVEPGVSL